MLHLSYCLQAVPHNLLFLKIYKKCIKWKLKMYFIDPHRTKKTPQRAPYFQSFYHVTSSNKWPSANTRPKSTSHVLKHKNSWTVSNLGRCHPSASNSSPGAKGHFKRWKTSLIYFQYSLKHLHRPLMLANQLQRLYAARAPSAMRRSGEHDSDSSPSWCLCCSVALLQQMCC